MPGRVVLSLMHFPLLSGALLAQAPDWTRHQPLPTPRGLLAVGTMTFHFTDSSRATSRHLAYRPLTVQVWYPARQCPPDAWAPYLNEANLLDSMVARRYLDVSEQDIRAWGRLRSHACLNAAPASRRSLSGWPVLVFSHGLGVAHAHYTSFAEQLVSHGYVVLVIDHPMGGFAIGPSGQVLAPGVDSVPYPYPRVLPPLLRDWATDASYVVRATATRLDSSTTQRFRLPLDTSRVGMLGHSLGGAAALQACHTQPLFIACADMDGDTFGDVDEAGVGKPFLVLLSEPVHQSAPTDSAHRAEREQLAQMGRERDSAWAATLAKVPDVPGFVVKVAGTGHMSFTDAPFQFPVLLQETGSTLSADRAFRLIAERLLDFFDHFLKGEPLRLLRPGAATIQ
jgi:dienelactone hydrolase